MENAHEFIGRSRVIDTRKEGAFVLKVLAPVTSEMMVEPNSEEAMRIAASHNAAEKKNPRSKRANPMRKGYSRR
jgi:hypothetical protein